MSDSNTKAHYQAAQAQIAQLHLMSRMLGVMVERELLDASGAAMLVQEGLRFVDQDNPHRKGFELMLAEFQK